MRVVNCRAATFWLGCFLLRSSVVFGGDLFQWTDTNGVLHFTDDISAIPETLRQLSNFTVRKDFFSPPAPSSERPHRSESPSPPKPEATRGSEIDSKPPVETIVTDSPEETTIVVVNSGVARPMKNFCGVGSNCKHVVRPDFNRQHFGHRGILHGGARQVVRR